MILPESVNPGRGCRPDGTPYPYVVACVGVPLPGAARAISPDAIMGGYETLDEAKRVRDSYQRTERKTKLDFVAGPNPAVRGLA